MYDCPSLIRRRNKGEVKDRVILFKGILRGLIAAQTVVFCHAWHLMSMILGTRTSRNMISISPLGAYLFKERVARRPLASQALVTSKICNCDHASPGRVGVKACEALHTSLPNCMVPLVSCSAIISTDLTRSILRLKKLAQAKNEGNELRS